MSTLWQYDVLVDPFVISVHSTSVHIPCTCGLFYTLRSYKQIEYEVYDPCCVRAIHRTRYSGVPFLYILFVHTGIKTTTTMNQITMNVPWSVADDFPIEQRYRVQRYRMTFDSCATLRRVVRSHPHFSPHSSPHHARTTPSRIVSELSSYTRFPLLFRKRSLRCSERSFRIQYCINMETTLFLSLYGTKKRLAFSCSHCRIYVSHLSWLNPVQWRLALVTVLRHGKIFLLRCDNNATILPGVYNS